MARRSDHVICRHCRKEFRAITGFHLRKIHGYDGEHPVLDYKRRFGLPFAMSGASRKRISVAKDDFWNRRGQHWTRSKLLAELRRVHRAGGSLAPRNTPDRLCLAGRRLFGTWQAAVEMAGLDYEHATGIRRWNRKRVVQEIRNLAADGVPVTGTHILRHYPYLHSVAVKHFPRSWSKALRAAGFDPSDHRQPHGKWQRRNASDWVERQIKAGSCLLARDAPAGLCDFVYRHLKIGWPEFVESFGVPYPGIKKRRDWTKEKVLDGIRRWKAARHAMNYRAVKIGFQALLHQAKKHFGSWDAARTAAGVSVNAATLK